MTYILDQDGNKIPKKYEVKRIFHQASRNRVIEITFTKKEDAEDWLKTEAEGYKKAQEADDRFNIKYGIEEVREGEFMAFLYIDFEVIEEKDFTTNEDISSGADNGTDLQGSNKVA